MIPATPLIKIDSFLLKREDLNPSGSVKDRATVVQLAWAKNNGFSRVAISSSGNAGISVAYWARRFSLGVSVFVSPKINPLKLRRLSQFEIKIITTLKPISDCIKFCQKEKAYNLRQSKDPRAIEGFAALGRELAQQLKKENPEAIFFPVSSGATFRGVMRGLLPSGLSLAPFIVQPASHPVLAKRWDPQFIPEQEHLAEALVAKVIPCREEIVKLVEEGGGGGMVVQNQRILKWHQWLSGKGLITSLEGALSLAGVEKAREERRISPKATVICLLTGRLYSGEPANI